MIEGQCSFVYFVNQVHHATAPAVLAWTTLFAFTLPKPSFA
jgi:hypothetical protein